MREYSLAPYGEVSGCSPGEGCPGDEGGCLLYASGCRQGDGSYLPMEAPSGAVEPSL